MSSPANGTPRRFALGGFWALLVVAAGFGASGPVLGEAAAPGDLTQLSLSDLANLEVTSVSKASEALQRAAAAVYVITHDDIMRSGATNIPEALRLAPNLLVTQTSSSAYVISARGFGGNPVAQNFSNKLLMLIDGRSVYTPLFSGIYADTLDVLLEDVDRIEVISGVGATLWGANAMNGVINVITRSSYLTQSGYIDAAAGNRTQELGGRYGDRINGDATFRVYGFESHRGSLELADASTARDGWSKGQGGFRGDWSADQDSLTVQGDLYRTTEGQLGTPDLLVTGGNLVTRYQRHGALSDLQVQAFYDMSERAAPAGGAAFVVHTYDIELQQMVAIGARNRFVWGGGERVSSYGIINTPTLLFEPPHHGLTLANVFLQDTFTLAPSLNFIAGLKLEDDPYSGWTALPDARLSWSVNDLASVWAAASHAIRSATPFDNEVVEKVGALTFLAANTQFRPEKVTAYELGVRARPASAFSLSIAAFYNRYDDLRTVDPASSTVFLPLYWGNFLRGGTYGIDAWGNWQVTDWWRLSPGVTWVRERLSFKPGASQLLGVAQAADDPSSHAAITSSMTLLHHTSLDASFRYVGALPDPALPHFFDLDLRLAWQATPALEVAVSGTNLLHARHTEFPAPTGDQITRSVLAEARWRF